MNFFPSSLLPFCSENIQRKKKIRERYQARTKEVLGSNPMSMNVVPATTSIISKKPARTRAMGLFNILGLVVLVQTCIIVSARINYEGLVLTSIDVKPIDGQPNRVKFSGKIKGKKDDDDAVFLKNVIQTNDRDEDGERLFEAVKVSVSEAKKIIDKASEDGRGKPLFCIHGFNVQPGSHLNSCKKHQVKFNQGKFMLVPVIWPSDGGVSNYLGDRYGNSMGAGEALKSLKKGFDCFPSKSLLAHSMGNRVLRFAANAKFKFDNIFMAAADVPHDLFNKSYIQSSDDPNSEKKDGLLITKMLSRDRSNKPKGKVHVLTNSNDYALTGSNWLNWKPRLGAVGAGYSRNWRGAFRFDPKNFDDEIPEGCIETKHCNPLLGITEKFKHGYHFNLFAVKFYQEKHI